MTARDLTFAFLFLFFFVCVYVLDFRIQTGDMLVRVSGCDIRSDIGSAYQQLSQPVLSIRVKVGRPDITSSIFTVQNGVEVREDQCVDVCACVCMCVCVCVCVCACVCSVYVCVSLCVCVVKTTRPV